MRRATLLLAVAAGISHAAPVSITLRDSARLENRTVKLADIAGVESDDAALARQFGATQLLMLGERGQTVRLTRERIRYALDKRLPGLQDAYRLSGAPAVRLTWSGDALDGASLQAWAATAMRELLQIRAPQAEVSITPYPLSPSTPLHVPPGTIAYAIRHVQPELTERMSVLVDVLVDGAVSLSVPVWLRVQGSQLAWRLRQDAQAGAAPDAALLEQVRVPVSHERLAGGEPGATPGARLRRARPAGSLLLSDDLDQKKPVARGSEIRVRIQRGGVEVEDRAVAMNDGINGARVRVVNPRTQASYLATVIGDGVAEVK
jgi:flagella basal body P-ring formation protein FlgA